MVREGEEMVVRDGEVCTASVVSVTPLRHCKDGEGAGSRERERERCWQRGVVGHPERSGTYFKIYGTEYGSPNTSRGSGQKDARGGWL